LRYHKAIEISRPEADFIIRSMTVDWIDHDRLL
jgi:hypothetical protein